MMEKSSMYNVRISLYTFIKKNSLMKQKFGCTSVFSRFYKNVENYCTEFNQNLNIIEFCRQKKSVTYILVKEIRKIERYRKD